MMAAIVDFKITWLLGIKIECRIQQYTLRQYDSLALQSNLFFNNNFQDRLAVNSQNLTL